MAEIQEQLYFLGFTTCPQHGELDASTQESINAYRMQFGFESWAEKNSLISDDCIVSLHGSKGMHVSLLVNSEKLQASLVKIIL
jgi:hypothetical protein